MQVAALEALSADTEAKLQSQARGHDDAIMQLQQERKGEEEEAHKEKLQQKVDELIQNALWPSVLLQAFPYSELFHETNIVCPGCHTCVSML